ncbi:MAG: hypothetical protein FJ125_06905, partial [Deltaproteobacteria bacterium]|nr:hypothetical protein [Deltaproteobacteria bacterium]
AAPLLRAHLAEGFGEVSEACREALVAMGDPPAAELLAAARELAREDWAALKQRGEVAVELLAAALRTPGADQASAVTRAGAAWTLGEIGSPLAREPLQAALQDSHPEVRAAAAQALGRLGDGEAEQALVACYGSVQPEVRIACIKALVALGGPMGQAMLAAALDDPAAEVRHAVYGLLGPGENLAAFDRLVQLLREPESEEKLGAIEALVQMGRPEAIDALVFLLADANPEVRRAAWDAQLRLGWHPIGWRSNRTDARFTYWTRRSEWLTVEGEGEGEGEREAKAAAKAEAEAGTEAITGAEASAGTGQLELLLAALHRSGDPTRRRVAAEGLGLLGERTAVQPLQQALHDPDRDVRIVAAESRERLGEAPRRDEAHLPYWVVRGRWDVCVALGEPAVAELALVFHEEPNELRRLGVCEALQRIGGAAAQRQLLQVSGDPLPAVRLAAIRGLAALDELQALPRLIAMLDDREVAPAAAEVLASLGCAEASGRLIDLLRSERPVLRRWAAEVLGTRRDGEARAALRRLLDDEQLDVRLAVLRSLCREDGEAMAAELVRLLQRAAEPELRAAAAAALGRLGRPALGEALVMGLGDSWGQVRRACALALEELGAPPTAAQREASAAIAMEQWSRLLPLGAAAVPLLLHAAADGGSDVAAGQHRSNAARLLGQIGGADERVRAVLLDLLQQDALPSVRAVAARALGALGDAAAAPALVAAFAREAGCREVRLALVEAAAGLDDPVVGELLTRALADRVPEVQVAAARVMRLSSCPLTGPLIAALESSDARLRQAAAEELGRLGDARAIDPLCLVLADTSSEVRRAARTALLALGWHPVGWRIRPGDKGYAYWTTRSEWLDEGTQQDQPQVPLLLAVARSDADPDRRRNAAEVLGLIGDPAALPGLTELAATDPDEAVRAAAREAVELLEQVVRRRRAEQPAPEDAAAAGGQPEAEGGQAKAEAEQPARPATMAERLARIQAQALSLAGGGDRAAGAAGAAAAAAAESKEGE